ncbi:DNA primase [Planosporangium mesophilum]|uniref:Uncharacterized protein n=1 Tax=Planosporangium mesophilum TaxID=689768 RepID=A0A8J3TGS2_9ACTN|nr:DNA primase [Planosporangium mesophilum]GII21180.1 hypothetical protein Pme01_07770 [Planosporangium mesophilum]
MARQPSGTGNAADSAEDMNSGTDAFNEADDAGSPAVGRSATTDALWADVRVQPIEIALPSGVGYTLRAYRLSTEVREPEFGDREDDIPESRPTHRLGDEDEDAPPGIDEDELTAQALAAGREGGRHRVSREDDRDDAEVARDSDEAGAETAGDADGTAAETEAIDEAEAEAEEPAEPEDVPVFLAEDGELLLFRSPEGLVEYVRGDADHELTQLDTWDELRARIEPEDIVPLDEDRYELDLVVENLRGGHDVWDPALIIQAGEVARDVAYALRIRPVMTALAPGSPLDDLDEGLRRVEEGGFGAFFARRRLRKIDPQTTAALSWRTVIGKISAVVDWRN